MVNTAPRERWFFVFGPRPGLPAWKRRLAKCAESVPAFDLDHVPWHDRGCFSGLLEERLAGCAAPHDPVGDKLPRPGLARQRIERGGKLLRFGGHRFEPGNFPVCLGDFPGGAGAGGKCQQGKLLPGLLHLARGARKSGKSFPLAAFGGVEAGRCLEKRAFVIAPCRWSVLSLPKAAVCSWMRSSILARLARWLSNSAIASCITLSSPALSRFVTSRERHKRLVSLAISSAARTGSSSANSSGRRIARASSRSASKRARRAISSAIRSMVSVRMRFSRIEPAADSSGAR